MEFRVILKSYLDVLMAQQLLRFLAFQKFLEF